LPPYPILISYIVKVSKNPDVLKAMVPFEVNSNLIFFGPCKKRLRENLYNMYLKDFNKDERDVINDIYLLGFNGANQRKIRKIVWLGKIQKLCTFEKMYNYMFNKKEFYGMLNHKKSPMHIEPKYNNNEGSLFIGYKFRGTFHSENNSWILDITSKKNQPELEISNMNLILKNPSKRKEIFNRDCCFLCKNLFFANGKGIEIDSKILKFLCIWQKNKMGIDKYAIFGKRKDDSADGLTGKYLIIQDNSVGNFIEYITDQINKIKIIDTNDKNITLRKC